MKKLLGIVVMGLFLLPNVGNTLSQDQAIKKYFSERPLANIEGIFRSTGEGSIVAITKTSSNNFTCVAIKHSFISSGNSHCNLSGSGNVYRGTQLGELNGQLQNINVMYEIFNGSVNFTALDYNISKQNAYVRIWPTNIENHNAKFNQDSGGVSLNFNLVEKKQQCEAIGFTPKTEKFADCVLKLVELDIKTQADNQITVAQNNGNTQIANELKQMRNTSNSQYLMDLGQQLLKPQQFNSNVYLPQTRTCTVQGFGSFSKVRCR